MTHSEHFNAHSMYMCPNIHKLCLYHLPATIPQQPPSAPVVFPVPVTLSQFRDDNVLPNLFHSAVQAQPLQANYWGQWIISLTIINNTAASDWSIHRMDSKSCSKYDSTPNTGLECGSLRPSSSNNRIQQLLETLKLHHLSHVSWYHVSNTFGTCPVFYFIYMNIFRTSACKKSPLLNQWKDLSLKFD